jgi:hypothetical protein
LPENGFDTDSAFAKGQRPIKLEIGNGVCLLRLAHRLALMEKTVFQATDDSYLTMKFVEVAKNEFSRAVYYMCPAH